jgi:hypothetical protein
MINPIFFTIKLSAAFKGELDTSDPGNPLFRGQSIRQFIFMHSCKYVKSVPRFIILPPGISEDDPLPQDGYIIWTEKGAGMFNPAIVKKPFEPSNKRRIMVQSYPDHIHETFDWKGMNLDGIPRTVVYEHKEIS